MSQENLQFLDGNQSLYQDYQYDQLICKGVNTRMKIINKQDKSDCKCLKISILEDQKDMERFQNQIKLIQKIQQNPHPNIINCDGYYLIQKQGEAVLGNIVTELGVYSLDQYIQKQSQTNQFMSPLQLMNFMQCSLDAIVHLAKMNIAHYNLKPENFILTDQNQQVYKLTDMQPEKIIQEKQSHTFNISGTVSFMSPELFENYRKFNYRMRYNPYKSDIYSLALIWLYYATYFKFTLELRQEINKQRYEKNISNLIFSAVSNYPTISGLKQIFQLCLLQNPNDRIYPEDLQIAIQQSNWLEFKDLTPPALSKTDSSYIPQQNEVDDQGYINFKLPQQFDKVEFYNRNPHLCSKANFDLNFIHQPVKDIYKITQYLYQSISDFNISLLKLQFELNFLDERYLDGLKMILFKFPKLEHLTINAWNNQLRDNGLKFLIEDLPQNKLKSLQLNFSQNKLQDISFTRILQFIAKNPLLEKLDLNSSMNKLTIDSALQLHQFEHLQSLTTLILNFESMSSVNDRFLEEISKLKMVKTIQDFQMNVSHTNVSDFGLVCIGNTLAQMDKLSSLTLLSWNTCVKDKGVNEFSKALENNKKLKKLNISFLNNKISNQFGEYFATSLMQLKDLLVLDFKFSNTNIGDQGIRVINLSNKVEIREVKEFCLFYDVSTEISSVGCRYIGRIIGECKKLQYFILNLSNNQLNVEGMEYLSSGLLISKQIQKLDLNLENVNSGNEGAIHISSSFRKLQKLKSLILRLPSNNLNNKSIPEVIKSIQEGPFKLSKLILDFNNNDYQTNKLEFIDRFRQKIEIVDIKLD